MKMWKDFFYFSRGEKQGIIVLIALICITLLINAGLNFYNKRRPVKEAGFPEEEYQRFISSIKEQDKARNAKPWERNGSNTGSARPNIVLSSFDPNVADSATFRRLGLPAWMATNILRYRAKGGVFRKPEDFKKIYGLKEEQFAELLPYIYISEQFQRPATARDTQSTIAQATEESDYTAPDTWERRFKYPAGTVIDLNAADTTELKKIPGIWSATAHKIAAYRRQLGGFYHVSQLHELGESVGKLTEWFDVKEGETQRINLNTASIERLRAHPYFTFYQAKVIVEHRKKKGDLKRLSQLSFYEEFTEEDLERMKHYVVIEN